MQDHVIELIIKTIERYVEQVNDIARIIEMEHDSKLIAIRKEYLVHIGMDIVELINLGYRLKK